MTALDRIASRSQLAAGLVAPRSGDVNVAAAGLARMRRLVDALGNPQRAYKTIHVAGSKGKGSTTAYAAAILTATGRKTGRYTSPHLMDWRERLAVDGQDISESDFDRVVSYVDSAMTRLEAERPDDPTHNAFELLTAAAFVHFAEVGCEVAVIEVGIGGRFDSTNVIDADVAVITTIEAEHLDMLGPTLRDVAWNKAGIIKPRSGSCVTVNQDPVVLNVLQTEAAIASTPLLLQGRDWTVAGRRDRFTVRSPRVSYADLVISNPIPAQLTNAAAAILAASIAIDGDPAPTSGQVQTGLDAGTLPGRFEVIDEDGIVVLDVAHTPGSIAAAGDAVRSIWPRRPAVAVVGLLADKDLSTVAAALASWTDHIVTTTSPSPRALPATSLAATISTLTPHPPASVDDPSAAMALARELAGNHGVILVTGSFALVAHIRRFLLNPP